LTALCAARGAAVLSVALALGSCFRPSLSGVDCGPLDECPRGFECDIDRVCRQPDDLLGRIDGSAIDAPPSPDAPLDAPPVIEGCDPVEQTGCSDSEKCTFIVTSVESGEPTGGRTDCAPETGDGLAGQPCAFTLQKGERVDPQCQAGLLCSALEAGTCRPICRPTGSPCGSGNCQSREGLFGDRPGHGLCID
jgi:hypothetical protein